MSMENYQMFFPCSSNDQSAYNHFNTGSSDLPGFNSTFHDHSSNGFLGYLKRSEMEVPMNRSVPVHEAKDINSDHQMSGSSSLNINGGGDRDKLRRQGMEYGGGGNKRKGEKKIRKQRFAFQTRSQVDILDDGYRWRKYGQKAVKNNKFPRSYYRCTHQGCNVKKQVQRLTKDEGIVVTTYEGIHVHPIDQPSENFERILSQMHIYTPF